jgi:hypothetical protein
MFRMFRMLVWIYLGERQGRWYRVMLVWTHLDERQGRRYRAMLLGWGLATRGRVTRRG